MLPEDIRTLTRAVPFHPFRVHITNGEVYEIRHPDMIVVSFGSAHIGVPHVGGPPDGVGTVRLVSMDHIVKIETLLSPSSTSGLNGAGPEPVA